MLQERYLSRVLAAVFTALLFFKILGKVQGCAGLTHLSRTPAEHSRPPYYSFIFLLFQAS